MDGNFSRKLRSPALGFPRYNSPGNRSRLGMSLQFRVLGAIAAMLLLALFCGGALLVLHARSEVEIEVRTAFEGARQSVQDTLKSDVQHTVTLRQVVSSFQGQRHVRAALVNEKGKIIVQSQIRPLTDPAPRWFVHLMTPPQLSAAIHINLRRFPCVVQLNSDPRSEIADVWGRARDAFLAMLLFCAGTMAMVSLAVTYAVRFFRRFQTGLLAVSDGDYDTRLESGGPPEFAALARGFNHMVERLAHFSDANRRLQQQIQSVQEEERAGIARDLHDEVGPYLFAIQVDSKRLGKSTDPIARETGTAIRDAVLHVQQHVKDILRQLRPGNSLDFGLTAAIDDLVAFWVRRHPDIRFERTVSPCPGLERQGEDAAYRIVQESLSNAVRHGQPTMIRITIADRGEDVLVCVEDDGGGLKFDGRAGMDLGHMGLAGMQERVHALGGRFTVEELRGLGVRIRAWLPKALQPETT
jgi:two-component system sensor histidine kinase UhpB